MAEASIEGREPQQEDRGAEQSSTETNALQGAAAQLGMRVHRERSPRL